MLETKKTDLFTRLKAYVDDETAERGYVYSHQKVDVQIDMLNQIIKGYTEISIKPLRFDVDVIRLHCRQCRISSIKINDFLAEFEINESEDAGIVGEISVYLPDEITDIPIINGV
ncbi:15007_t:CDS:2, partial [Dentiscutata heterogama]